MMPVWCGIYVFDACVFYDIAWLFRALDAKLGCKLTELKAAVFDTFLEGPDSTPTTCTASIDMGALSIDPSCLLS